MFMQHIREDLYDYSTLLTETKCSLIYYINIITD